MAPADIKTMVAALGVGAIAALDAFVFNKFGVNADLILIVSAAGGLGLHVAFDAGKGVIDTPPIVAITPQSVTPLPAPQMPTVGSGQNPMPSTLTRPPGT